MTEEWIQYFKRFQNFLKANKIEGNEQKTALLLTVMGAGMYKLSQNLAAPADVIMWKINEISDKLQAHFQPKALVVMETYHFYLRIKKENDAVTEYLAELRRLAAKCSLVNF